MLILSLPLLAVLSGQGRVALIAHELAHAHRQDMTRTMLINSALHSLAHWDDFFAGTLYLAPLRELVRVIASGLCCLICFEWQLAEYRADVLAAHVAGPAALMEVFDTVRYDELALKALRDAANPGLHISDPLRHLQGLFAALPASEKERQRRREAAAPVLLGDTHPPVTLRREVLAWLSQVPDALAPPSFVLPPHQDEQIRAELAALFQWWNRHRLPPLLRR